MSEALREGIIIREAQPSDYQGVISVLNDWWGGRSMSDMLPKLFFTHFQRTSFIAERDGALAGFLVGFCSQTFADESYIHFAGVNPEFRRQDVARLLYERFFATSLQMGRTVVRGVTSPVNKVSVAFHTHMGFALEPSDTVDDGIPVHLNYDGPGEHRVLFVKRLTD